LIGERASKAEYALFVMGACLLVGLLWWTGSLPFNRAPWLPAAFVAAMLVLAVQRSRQFWKASAPPEYNRSLAATANHHLIFGLGYACTILLA
jgi:1,4-dihydroxy-2-naphthoate octaprenyltransferase